MKLHSANQRYHAKCRFKERFDINLNKTLRRSIIHKIKNKKLILVDKQKQEFKYYYIHDNKEMLIVYDKKTNNIVTCMYYDVYLESRFNRFENRIVKLLMKELFKMYESQETDVEKILAKLRPLLKDNVTKIRYFTEIEMSIRIEKLSMLYLKSGNKI